MKEKTVLLIAYGTLMTGERNHRFCENAVSITPCIVKGTLYDTGYGFPAFVPEGATEVKAELIEIHISAWADIDRLEGYPRLYDLYVPLQLLRASERLVHPWDEA